MPVLTFRVNVPNATPALSPITLTLKPLARFVKKMIGPWSNTTTLDMSKTGFRFLDRGNSQFLIPDVGSNDNAIQANAGEAGWAPIMSAPTEIDFLDQELQGPPYELNFQFYNTAAAAIIVAGIVVVDEPFAFIDQSMLYEIATRGNPPRQFFEPKPAEGSALPMEGGDFPGQRSSKIKFPLPGDELKK